jgi:hypothetical protein
LFLMKTNFYITSPFRMIVFIVIEVAIIYQGKI